MKGYQAIAEDLLHNHKRHKRYIALLTALSLLMAFMVSLILIEPAESRTGEQICGQTEHVHSLETCFALACGLMESEEHVHSEECFALTCETPVHVHSQECYETVEDSEEHRGITLLNEPAVQPLANATTGNVGFPPYDNGSTVGIDDVITDVTGIPGKKLPKITSISINGTQYKDGDTYVNKQAEDELQLDFEINYELTSTDVTLENPYIYYQLPDGITLPDDLYGEDYAVMDGEITAGYYSISKDGLIVIRFNDSYIKDHIAPSTIPITGYIDFTATVQRENDADGDRDLVFDQQTTITVEFPDKQGYDIIKDGYKIVPEYVDGDLQIEWTIQAISYSDSESLKDFIVSDDKFPANGTGVTVNPSGYGEFRQDTETGKWYYYFTSDLPAGVNTATFTFRETITLEEFRANYGSNYQWTAENTANLTNTSKNVDESDKGEVKFEGKPTVSKHGTPDYEYLGTYDGYMVWTITVNHPYGMSLINYSIIDEAFSGAEIISVTDKRGDSLSYSYDNNKTIKITGDASRVTIVYKKKITGEFSESNPDTITATNDVTLMPPPGIYGDKPVVENRHASADYENQQTLKDKTGKYNYDTGEITWTVGAKVKDTSVAGATLNGYTLTDDAFANLNLLDTNLGIKATNEKNETLTITSRTADEIVFSNGAKITKTGNTLTITGKIHEFDLTYKTQYVSGTTPTEAENGKTYVKNTVKDKFGRSKVGRADVTPRDTTKKSYLKSTGLDDLKDFKYISKDSTDKIVGTLYWQVDVTRDAGFADYAMQDVVYASINNDQTANGVNHYINPASIVVKARTKSTSTAVTLTKGTDYDIVFSPDETNPTSFSIQLKGTALTKGYHYLTVTYNSTVEIDAPSDGTWDFDNDGYAKFHFWNIVNDQKAESGDFTLRDTSVIEKGSVTIEKKWKGNNQISDTPPENSGITSIKFRLQRKTGENGTWQTIWYDNGEWIVVVPDDKAADAPQYCFELDTAVGSMTFDNMPKETADHTSKYYYRAVEIDTPSGFTAYYTKEDTGISSGTFTITNGSDPLIRKEVVHNGKTLPEGSEISIDDMEPVQIGTDWYYAITYKVSLDNYTNNVLLTDKIPDGFTLAYVEGYVAGDVISHHPIVTDLNSGNKNGMWYRIIYDNSSPLDNLENMQVNNFVYDKASDIAYFMLGAQYSLEYEILIPVDNLKLDDPIVNTAVGSDGKKGTATVTITSSVEDDPSTPKDKSLVTKTLGAEQGSNAQRGKIEYTLYVNPEGKKLSNADTYDIVDLLRLSGADDAVTRAFTAGQLKVSVEEVKDCVLDSNGKVTSATYVRDLQTYEYPYNVTTQTIENVEDVDLEITRFQHNGAYNDVGLEPLMDYKGVTEFTFDIYCKDSAKGQSETFTFNGVTKSGVYDSETGIMRCTFSMEVEMTKGVWWQKSTGCGNWGNFDHLTLVSLTYPKKSVESTAEMTINVPDGIPLRITYSYIVTDEGRQEDDGDIYFNAKNTSSLNTGNYSSSDSRNERFKMNYSSGAGIETGNTPKIIKYNIGNAGQTLTATFYIAKYVNGNWVFAVADELEDVKNSEGKVLEQGHRLAFELVADGNGIPPASGGKSALPITISSNEEYKLLMDGKTLYKIIEITAPAGYEAANSEVAKIGGAYGTLKELLEAELGNYLDGKTLGDSKYENLLKKFVAVHYFKYGSEDVTSMPSDAEKLKMNVSTVQAGGTLGIPNNELINISASKTWDASAVNPGKVKVKLYWSYTKVSNGFPDDSLLFEAKADDLGLDSNFSNVLEIDPSSVGNLPTWSNLPNGKDDRPIYYYIKEIEYTVDGQTYRRNDEDGNFYLVDDETDELTDELGEYERIYTNNGTNKKGTIKVRNTKGLSVTKIWHNSDNKDLTAIPVASIPFELYGVTEDGVVTEEPIYTGELSANTIPAWTMTIPADLDDDDDSTYLSDYTSFKVVEVVTAENGLLEKLYRYTISYNYNTVGATGEITITNKNLNPTNVDVTAEKIWADGEDHDAVKVTLYRSTVAILESELTNITLPDSRLEAVEELEDYEYDLGSETDNNGNKIWSHTWEGLPYQDNEGNRFYYYPLETVPNGFRASYVVADRSSEQTITITNSVPGNLSVTKTWKDASGTLDAASIPASKVKFKLYRRAITSTTDDATGTLPAGLKILATGDSITEGVGATKGENDYPKQLEGMFYGDGFTDVTVDNNGHSNYTIEYIEPTWGNGSYSISTIIAGTNNVINTEDTMDEMKEKMRSLIDTVFSKGGNNHIIFLGSIPKYTACDSWKRQDSITHGNAAAWDNLVRAYNTMLSELVIEYQNSDVLKAKNQEIYYVDIYTAVGDELGDGIHPTVAGYTKIAQAFYDAILNRYDVNIKKSDVPQGIEGLPSDFYKPDGNVNTDDYELVEEVLEAGLGKGEFILPYNGSWSRSFPNLPMENDNNEKYVYYVVEEDSKNAWQVTYSDNGQIITQENGASIGITNTIQTISLEVQKRWNDEYDSHDDPVSFHIYRTTNENKIKKLKQTPDELTINGQKSYTVRVVKDGTAQITLNEGASENLNITVDPPGVLACSQNGNVITINTEGAEIGQKFTVTISDGYSSVTVNVEITAEPEFELTINGVKSIELPMDETATLSATYGGNPVSVTYNASENNVVEINNQTGVVTPKIYGKTITISAIYEGKTETVTVTTVLPKSFDLKYQGSDETSASIKKDAIITVYPYLSYGSFEYSYSMSNDGNYAEYIEVTPGSDGAITVKGLQATPEDVYITITATRKGTQDEDVITRSVTLTVTEDAVVEPDPENPPGGDGDTEEFSINEVYDSSNPLNFQLNDASNIKSITIIFSDISGNADFELRDNNSQQVGYGWLSASWDGSSIDVYYGSSFDYICKAVDNKTIIFDIENNDMHTLRALNLSTSGSWKIEKIIITYATTATASTRSSLKIANKTTVKTYAAATGEWKQTDDAEIEYLDPAIQLTGNGDDWKATIDNLPAKSADGKDYYYWVEEVPVGGYADSYAAADGNGSKATSINASHGSGSIVITNTKNENPGTQMPSTGGTGTRPYQAVGITLTGLTLTALLLKKRRQNKDDM